MTVNRALIEDVTARLAAEGDPERAESQQRYMKSSMPYLGVTLPRTTAIAKEVFAAHPLASYEEWRDTVLALFRGAEYRELWYVAEELAVTTPYRQVVAAFDRWHDDLQPEPPPDALRGDLLTALKGYFERQQIEADWETIKDAPLAGLVTSLVMICPFEPNEKQALLEAANLNAQAELLIALMCMAGTTGAAEPSVLH